MNWAMKEKSDTRRQASALVGIDPRAYRRKSKRPADTALRGRMKEPASDRRRFGYRRLHILLKREGWTVNWIGSTNCAATAAFRSATMDTN